MAKEQDVDLQEFKGLYMYDVVGIQEAKIRAQYIFRENNGKRDHGNIQDILYLGHPDFHRLSSQFSIDEQHYHQH